MSYNHLFDAFSLSFLPNDGMTLWREEWYCTYCTVLYSKTTDLLCACRTNLSDCDFSSPKPQDYNDETDLLNDEHQKPESAQSQLPKTVSTSPISPTDLTALSEISLADDEESTIDEPVGEHSRPPSVSDLALNSAAKEIQRLEGELKKVNVDRDHWKTLAKQVGTFYLLLVLFLIGNYV